MADTPQHSQPQPNGPQPANTSAANAAAAPADPFAAMLGAGGLFNPELLGALIQGPMAAGQQIFGALIGGAADGAAPAALPGLEAWGSWASGQSAPLPDPQDAARWAEIAARLQAMWLGFQQEQALKASARPLPMFDPAHWHKLSQPLIDALGRQWPLARPDAQHKLVSDSLALWESIMGQYGLGPRAGEARDPADITLPRADKRFADKSWREHPWFAALHQTYLLVAEQLVAMADSVEGVDEERREQLRFAARTLVDALSPDHFPLTNPLVIAKALETRGESLVKGFGHLLEDLRRGQLTHTDPNAFKVGENIATTPGKVVHESRLFELIQYTPTTQTVMECPLVIFPPWINRFYILDLNPKKSFVKWAVDQGISTFMVSWKSADASMADVTWDDYIAAQIEAIEVARARLKAPAAHTIGYCVAGTTLAATLAILARQGRADIVRSATFFTAQVDFEKAGELKNFISEEQLATLQGLASEGYVDGRYLAATFNLLRGNDLIWNYVLRNYLLGEDYPAFDLLYWNGDSTNLPAQWHQSYLKDLYRDNRLVVPDSLSACGTPIDLTRITTPCYIQAGREDHIAPPESVWRLTGQLKQAPYTFVLAGSGHIAGVVNPPATGKYQYWTNAGPCASLEEFAAGAQETAGSWWPHWLAWLGGLDGARVKAQGKRVPGGRGDKVLGEAPGRFVLQR